MILSNHWNLQVCTGNDLGLLNHLCPLSRVSLLGMIPLRTDHFHTVAGEENFTVRPDVCGAGSAKHTWKPHSCVHRSDMLSQCSLETSWLPAIFLPHKQNHRWRSVNTGMQPPLLRSWWETEVSIEIYRIYQRFQIVHKFQSSGFL